MHMERQFLLAVKNAILGGETKKLLGIFTKHKTDVVLPCLISVAQAKKK